MEKASFNVFLATIALAVLAFVPPAVVSLTIVKTVIIAVGILLSFILYLISRIREGSLSLPLHPVIWIGGLLGLSVIISTLLSVSPSNSFIGTGFDQYNGAFTLVVLLAGLLTILLCRTRERVASVVVTVIGSFILAAFFALTRIFIALIPNIGSNVLGLSTFSTLTSTMVGSWYDLAILAGVVFLISFFTLESFSSKLLPVSRRLRVISIVLFIISFVVLFLIDLSLIWIGIALVIFCLLIYRFFSGQKTKVAEGKKEAMSYKGLPYFALVMFIIAALFAWKGYSITGPVIQKMNISYAEVSLPPSDTRSIAFSTLKQSPLSALFGAGPDRFSEQYLLYEPAGINHTQFWNITFPNGFDFVLTSLVDIGGVGSVLMILFIGWFIVLGVRVMCRSSESLLSRYMLITTFLTALFLWWMLFLYAPSHAIILITMIMTGLFLSVFSMESKGFKMFELREMAWSQSWKSGKSALIISWLAILVLAAGCYFCVKDAIAEVYFQFGINASVAGNVVAAHADIEKALTFKKSDTYYQALAQIDAYEINTIVSSASTASSSVVSTVGSLLNEGISFARLAQHIDPGNANNFLAEGGLSAIAAALNVPNAYADSRAAYIDAINISPMNPATYLSLGRLDYAEGSTSAAVAEISEALQLKPDYTDALFEAGVISYNAKNYQTAAEAFGSVLKVDATYSNAEYFLGLTFVRANDVPDAITVFTDLAKLYPQNTAITAILTDLKNGVSIFPDTAGQSPAVGNASLASTSPKVAVLSKSITVPKNSRNKTIPSIKTGSSTSQ